jgi:uncharacterized protein DUF5676
MDKLNPISIGVSGGITAAVLGALCAAAFVLWPDATIEFFNSWMHGLDLNKARSSAPLTVDRVLYGVIVVAIIGFVSGVLFASVHNPLNRREGS